MRPEERLAEKARELAEGYIQIANNLREIRRMLCLETDDPSVMCDKMWDEYRQKAT